MRKLTLAADLLTPVGAFLRLREAGRFPFLMESATGGERFGRYSIIGCDPSGEILAERPGHAHSTIGGQSSGSLLEMLKTFPQPNANAVAPFGGGLVGVIGFDWIFELESLNPRHRGKLPVAWLGNYTRFAVFDHVKQEVSLCNANSDSDDALHEWAERLRGPMPIVASSCSWGDRRSSVTQSDFCASVDCFKEHIRKGDIFQGVLSQKFSRAFDGDAFQLYRALRRVNPSPFMFYHETPVGTFVGASPELQAGIRAREVRIDPIAGTRPRGNDEPEDVKNEQDLKADKKELAEHMMLVDLARNDLGRVCDFGSVRVHELAQVHRFSHVMHMVSDVRGRLSREKSAADALAASFPAGTVSGAPKVRALEIILENEPVSRDFYSGAAGFLSRNGDSEFCIMLRTAVWRDGELTYQAGAGIVADSVPEREFAETEHKAAAIERALLLLASER